MRGGLLRQGSILTVTSYATRTSPVIRGKWILENILGTPPPPPPANVPALKDNTVSSSLSVRERLAEHRANVACAGCHKLMDPVGFSLENFDAVGRWRDFEEGRPDRRDRRPARRQPVRGRDRPRTGPAEAPRAVRRHADREAPDVRPGQGRRSLTTRRPSARSCARPARRIIASRR